MVSTPWEFALASTLANKQNNDAGNVMVETHSTVLLSESLSMLEFTKLLRYFATRYLSFAATPGTGIAK
jgi:hypothetical protein